MIETVQYYDSVAMWYLHRGIENALFDTIMPWIRNPYFWSPLYLFGISVLLINYGRTGYRIIVFAVFLIATTDQINSQLIKPIVNRTRPCNDERLSHWVMPRIKCGSGKSFPSTHAVNHFAISIFAGLVLRGVFRYFLWVGLVWAGLISLAQVYVGVHYPLDVIGGCIEGIVVGAFFFMLMKGIFSADLETLHSWNTKT